MSVTLRYATLMSHNRRSKDAGGHQSERCVANRFLHSKLTYNSQNGTHMKQDSSNFIPSNPAIEESTRTLFIHEPTQVGDAIQAAFHTAIRKNPSAPE